MIDLRKKIEVINVTKIITGIHYTTKVLAEKFIREQRRKFIDGLVIIKVKDGFVVVSDREIIEYNKLRRKLD